MGFWDGSGKWKRIEQILRLPGSGDSGCQGYGNIVIPGWTVHCLHCDMTMIEREGKARRICMERLWDICWDLL